MPFRDAYKLTGCMVSDCIAKDKTLEELTLDAVSYTHLLIVSYFGQFAHGKAGNLAQLNLSKDCLLYTSRCV